MQVSGDRRLLTVGCQSSPSPRSPPSVGQFEKMPASLVSIDGLNYEYNSMFVHSPLLEVTIGGLQYALRQSRWQPRRQRRDAAAQRLARRHQSRAQRRRYQEDANYRPMLRLASEREAKDFRAAPLVCRPRTLKRRPLEQRRSWRTRRLWSRSQKFGRRLRSSQPRPLAWQPRPLVWQPRLSVRQPIWLNGALYDPNS